MLKMVTKLLFIITIIVSSIIYFITGLNSEIDNSPIVVEYSGTEELNTLLDFLNNGEVEYLSKENFNILINDYPDLIEYPYIDIDKKIDRRDYRYTPYIDSLYKLFQTEDSSLLYILRENISGWDLIRIGKWLSFNGFNYKSNYLTFLVLSILSIVLLIVTLSIGSRVRSFSIIGIIPGILLFSKFNIYLYLSIGLSILIFIVINESLKVQNRYTSGSSIGIVRSFIAITIFLTPLFPALVSDNSGNNLGLNRITYEEMEDFYLEDYPNVSNFFSNYAFQSKVLYDSDYVFPSYNSSVTINEFKKLDNSLELVEEEVLLFNHDFLADFKEYLAGTKEGRLYFTSNRVNDPFHIDKKEYMQICILAVIMLISLLLLQKKYK